MPEKPAMHQATVLCNIVFFAISLTACSATDGLPTLDGGVQVGAGSQLRKLVPSAQLEAAAARQYTSILHKAVQKKTLAPDNNAEVVRLRKIVKKLSKFGDLYSNRAGGWLWEINLIQRNEIGVYCLPGGKIIMYTGLLNELKPTDSEIATILAHEIAHALREHARDHLAQKQIAATNTGTLSGIRDNTRPSIVTTSSQLLHLNYSMSEENDADKIGLELAARAGFDPRAGITAWQKMRAALQRSNDSNYLTAHRSTAEHIAAIENRAAAVLPLYEGPKSGEKAEPDKRKNAKN